MPPKPPPKEKVVKGDEAEEMVLNYLREMNRPFASTDVSANLKNRVPKGAAQKIMATLAEKGSLTVKPYGKQTIYVYNQSQLDVLAPEELATLDEELKSAQGELDEKRRELKSLQAELVSKESKPKTKDINKEIERIREENEVTLKALLPYRGAADGQPAIKPMSAADTKKIDEDFAKWRKEWVERRKVYRELLGMLADGGQIVNVPEFEDDQGINPDDEDAQEVEQGDFCKAPGRAGPVRLKQIQAPPPKAVPGKRAGTAESSQSVDEPPAKKKKGKKV